MKNIYVPERVTVKETKQESPQVKTLTLKSREGTSFDCDPGQFVEVTIFGYGEFPVSVSNVIDSEEGLFQVTIREIGKVTRETQNVSKEDILGVRGPFGNGYPLDKMKKSDIWLVAGGIGLSGLRYLIMYLLENKDNYGKLSLLYGSKKPEDMLYKGSYLTNKEKARENGLELYTIVEEPNEAWDGNVGVVTDLFEKPDLDPKQTIGAICGPSVMMKYATAELSDLGIDENDIFLSMERRMQCGMGICGHCMIGQKKVCLEGPVFSYGEIKGALERVF